MAELSTLGKYEIRRELGRGAMGIVYEGYDPLIKRLVALKTIRADQLSGENAETVLARFRREAQAAGRLSHPNIVAIYDFGEDAGVWYIAMELVDGRELKDYFQTNERFATDDIVRMMTQILAALGYSHKLGVIHRDIKPANVFVLKNGDVKVGDFGVAHIESSKMTQVGTVLGTPSYMSPEQILGLPIDGRTDLFSAGVVLYQFLTGERPFSGSSTTTMHKILEENPLPPSRLNVQIPGAMDAVVRKALAKRPEERFQTAEEFADALKVAAQQDTVSVHRAAAPAFPSAASASSADPTLIGSADPTVLQQPAAAGPSAARPAATEAKAAAPAGASAAPSSKKPQVAAIAIVAVALIAVAAVAWIVLVRPSDEAARTAQAPQATASPPASPAKTAPAVATPATPAGAAPAAPAAPMPPRTEPGQMMIAATGLVDPRDPRYSADKSLMQSDLRADSKSQVVAKALGMMLDSASLAKNYDLLKDRLLSKSGSYITAVVQESPPQEGKDGLVSMTTQAVVDVRALQKSLNQMSRDERIELIRASGDPKVAVRVSVREAEDANAPPQSSTLAENIIKERIRSFGFRTWGEDGARSEEAQKNADFLVVGEVQMKKLSTRLAASGLTITKYALASWTVKCIDRATGEEIYFNTTLPKATGSWASEAEALQAIGAKIADEFSRGFFLQHVPVAGRRVTLTVQGMPASASEDPIARELIGLPAVITSTPRAAPGARVYDLQVAGAGPEGDVVSSGVLKPLNAKLGMACFSLGQVTGDQVTVVLEKNCADAAVLARLDTNPPAGLYGAPPARQKALIRDQDTLRKLAI